MEVFNVTVLDSNNNTLQNLYNNTLQKLYNYMQDELPSDLDGTNIFAAVLFSFIVFSGLLVTMFMAFVMLIAMCIGLEKMFVRWDPPASIT